MILMNSETIKTTLGTTHLRYLNDIFGLKYPDSTSNFGDIRPDLTSTHDKQIVLFEVKSRTFPRNQTGKRKRPISDYGWWFLDSKQIQGYEKYSYSKGAELFWILILARTSDTKKITGENSIDYREIYFLPWEMYKSIFSRGQKNIGLNDLKRTYSFKRREVKKGVAYFEESIVDKVANYIKIQR